MDIWIRSVRTWAHLDRRRAASWTLPVFSSGNDSGTITVPGETNDYTGDWLICDGRLYTIKSCSPKNGVTQISVQLPEQAFARQLRYSGTGAERFGTFIAATLQTEYVDQTDAMYSMPYLSVSSLDTTAFAFPVEDGAVYTLLQIIRLAAASGVYLTWTPSISGLAVQIAARAGAVHHLFFASGHEQLVSQTYTSSVVAKATVRQTETDRSTGEVTVLDSATYYWHADGSFSTTPPDPRIPGTWVLTDVDVKKTLEEGAASAFGRNTQAYKIEFYSDRELQIYDTVLCRIGELVVRGYVTFARHSSGDSRIFYRAGDAATTLTEKVGALGSGGGSTVIYGGGGGGGGGSAAAVAEISLPLSWTDSGSGYHTCTPTITGATISGAGKIDLQPTQAQTLQLQADGVTALYVANNAGTLTAYAVGGAPSVALSMQCTVETTDAVSGVLGDTVGLGGGGGAASGVYDIWTWVKHDDGRSECWGSVTVTTGFAAWSSPVYYGTTYTPNKTYPDGLFVSTPTVFASLIAGDFDAWLATDSVAKGNATRSPRYYPLRIGTVSGSNHPYTVTIYAKGRWK